MIFQSVLILSNSIILCNYVIFIKSTLRAEIQKKINIYHAYLNKK